MKCGGASPALRVVGPTRLDMDSAVIQCQAHDRATGVEISGSGARVKNGVIDRCEFGVRVVGDGHKVSGMLVSLFEEDAFQVTGNGNELERNVADESNDGQGYVIGGDANTLRENVFRASIGTFNEFAFSIGGDANKIIGNIVNATYEEGFSVGGDRNVLNGNRVIRSGQTGIVVGGTANRVLRNTVRHTGRSGYQVNGELNVVKGNMLSDWDDGNFNGYDISGSGRFVDNIAAGCGVGPFSVDAAVAQDGNRNVCEQGLCGDGESDAGEECDITLWSAASCDIPEGQCERCGCCSNRGCSLGDDSIPCCGSKVCTPHHASGEGFCQ